MPCVSDYSSEEAVTVERGFGLLETAKLMRDHHVGCVVVVDEATGQKQPIGILTDRDIVVGVLAQTDRQLHLVRAEDVMTRNPLQANAADDLSDTLMAMRAKGVRRVPVVSAEGSLVGVLSFDDVLDYVHDEVTDLARLVGRGRRREAAARPMSAP
jgi:CBS domain-containing protein